MGSWRIKVTVCNVLIGLLENMLASFLSMCRKVKEVSPIWDSGEVENEDYSSLICLKRKRFPEIPDTIVYEGRHIMVFVEGRQPNCWLCRQLGQPQKRDPLLKPSKENAKSDTQKPRNKQEKRTEVVKKRKSKNPETTEKPTSAIPYKLWTKGATQDLPTAVHSEKHRESLDGHVLWSNRDIHEAFWVHFRDHFAHLLDLPISEFCSYLANFPCLQKAEAAGYIGLVTQVHDALKQVSLNKLPRLDGLPYEVYLRMSHMFVSILTDMFKHWFAQGTIPGSITKGVITLLKVVAMFGRN